MNQVIIARRADADYSERHQSEIPLTWSGKRATARMLEHLKQQGINGGTVVVVSDMRYYNYRAQTPGEKYPFEVRSRGYIPSLAQANILATELEMEVVYYTDQYGEVAQGNNPLKRPKSSDEDPIPNDDPDQDCNSSLTDTIQKYLKQGHVIVITAKFKKVVEVLNIKLAIGHDYDIVAAEQEGDALVVTNQLYASRQPVYIAWAIAVIMISVLVTYCINQV